jgi:hypothetical protein
LPPASVTGGSVETDFAIGFLIGRMAGCYRQPGRAVNLR